MKPKIGTRVKYHRQFLRNIGVFSGELCFMQGEITEIKGKNSCGKTIVFVTWDDGSKSPCLLDNLEEIKG